MKNLIILNGTMGVGKTTTCRELQNLLPNNVFLDGDWCWDMKPFVVTQETKSMVMENILFLLNQFIHCSAYENIIFCWVLHEQDIIDTLLSRLNTDNCSVKIFCLTATKSALLERLQIDINRGTRSADVIPRSMDRLTKYETLHTQKLDVSDISAKQTAQLICEKLLT